MNGNKYRTDFRQQPIFPHCIGAVDGKHIGVKNPANSGSMSFRYKDHFSIILAVVDSDYRFRYVSVGSYGKDCDSSVFKTSLEKVDGRHFEHADT
jgi:hypothetical protein